MKKQSYFLERNTGRIILAVVAVTLLAACAPAAKTVTVTQPPNANVTVTVTQPPNGNVTVTVTQPITTTPAPVTLPIETTTLTPPAITITQTESVTTTVTPPTITVTETSTITSTVTVTPPPTQEPPKWTITRFIYYVMEETEAYWLFEWHLTIRNEFGYGLELSASINYLDEEGNIAYTGRASPLVLNKGETKTFLGSNIISAVIAPRITSAAVELEEL